MQIVIDIPEETVNEIKDNAMFAWSVSSDIRWDVTSAIVNGTPLPKGHKRLIEDNFDVGPVFDQEGCIIGYKYVTQEDLNNAQTVIEADIGSEE